MRIGIRHCLLLFACGVFVPFLRAQTCLCAGFGSSRAESGWSFTDGTHFSRTRANLADLAFFGSSGVVNQTIVLGTGVQTATSLSSVNIFFTGMTTKDSYSTAERTGILDAVKNGMNLVLTADDSTHDISDLFNVTLDSAGTIMSSVNLPDHPIFAGPFGRVAQFRGADKSASFRSWPTGTLLLASSTAGPTMLLIPKGTLSASAGAVVLMSDTDFLTTFDRGADPNVPDPSLPVSDALLMNMVAFLCNPTTQAVAPHLVFPQFVHGDGNASSLILSNTGTSNILSSTVSFKDDNGSNFFVNLAGQGSVSTFAIGNLTPNETRTYDTTGLGALKSGSAFVRGSSLLAGNVEFLAPGLGIVGVGTSEVAGGFLVPVVPVPTVSSAPGDVAKAGDVYTGLAVTNMTAKEAKVRLELWDNNGRRSDGVLNTTVPAYGHIAKFLYQLLPSFDFTGFKGTLRVVSSNALLAVTALQLGTQAGQFTALPVKAMYR